MGKWVPLGLIICLSCTSLLMMGGQVAGSSYIFAQQSIEETQGPTPTIVVVSLNTTEIFAFSSGKVTLNIMSDGDGTLVVNITNAEGAILATSNQVAFTLLNYIYEVPFDAAWGALPGTFSLQVTAWYVNVTNGNSLDPVLSGTVNVRVGLGLMLGAPLLLAIVIFALVMAIKLRKPASKETTEAAEAKSSAEGTSLTSSIANKIRCPECKKLIDEGSVFCAECGARVPEFLRYNTPQA